MVTFNGPVTVGLSVQSGRGNIIFADTVDGPGALAVFGTGTTTFSAPLGSTIPLSFFRTDTYGIYQLNGGSVTTQ